MHEIFLEHFDLSLKHLVQEVSLLVRLGKSDREYREL